jgi:protein-disulfide isomerase/uncharacterized membrane protein
VRKRLLVAVAFACLIGAAIAAISTSQYVRIQKQGLEEKSFCAISEVIDCDIASASSYATLWGIPTAWLGLVSYLLIGGMALFGAVSKKERRATVTIAWFMSIFAVLYSIRMAYILVSVLGVVCLECVGMYLINILVLIGLWAALKVRIKDLGRFFANYIKAVFGKSSELGFKPNVMSHGILILAVFAVGWLVVNDITGKSRDMSISTKEMVGAHYEQSLYAIEPASTWPVWGNPNGRVSIIEFSDFECPFCRLAAFNIRPYIHEFKKDVRVYFVNYPLDQSCNPYMQGPMHQKACMAAFAVECANERGDFWGFHDDVFRLKRNLSRDAITGLAVKRGWNADDFAACMDSEMTKARVLEDIEIARKMHISGTPTIIINGRKLKYWRDPAFIRAVIKEELKKGS